MGLFSGGLTFGSFFVYQIVGLIFGWANFWVGFLSGVYGIKSLLLFILAIMQHQGQSELYHGKLTREVGWSCWLSGAEECTGCEILSKNV